MFVASSCFSGVCLFFLIHFLVCEQPKRLEGGCGAHITDSRRAPPPSHIMSETTKISFNWLALKFIFIQSAFPLCVVIFVVEVGRIFKSNSNTLIYIIYVSSSFFRISSAGIYLCVFFFSSMQHICNRAPRRRKRPRIDSDARAIEMKPISGC